MGAHADADDGDFGDIGVVGDVAVTDFLAMGLDRRQGAAQLAARHREGEIGLFSVLGDILHDHVHIDPGIRQGSENG